MKPHLPHNSMRGYFGWYLYDEMAKNDNIWVITCDLGYGLFDAISTDFNDRFVNVGASEQAGVGMAVGMALEGKIPVVYSITPFLLARPYETIRNYIDHESIPVKLIGSGRDDDYKHDGFSHDANDADIIVKGFPNIAEYWPERKEEMGWLVKDMLYNEKPSFVSLTR